MERKRAPVAQLDRALASGARGRGFESRRVRHFFAHFEQKIQSRRTLLYIFTKLRQKSVGTVFIRLISRISPMADSGKILRSTLYTHEVQTLLFTAKTGFFKALTGCCRFFSFFSLIISFIFINII